MGGTWSGNREQDVPIWANLAVEPGKASWARPNLVTGAEWNLRRGTNRLQKGQLYQEERVPDEWIVDFDARHVERWGLGDKTADVLTGDLVWHPDARTPPLTIDLRDLFALVWR